MNDQTPNAESLNEASPAISFSLARRAVSDVAQDAAPDPPCADVVDVDLKRRLSDIEDTIQRVGERFDQLEFVIVEQFEPGMTQAGELPAGNLRERLDRIEAALGSPETPCVVQDAETGATMASAFEQRLDGLMARLEDADRTREQRSTMAEEADARLDRLERVIADLVSGAEARHETVLKNLELVMRRPAPAPDLTTQHRSFAGFATALQTALGRYEEAANRIVVGLDAVAGRISAVEAALDGQATDAANHSSSQGLEHCLGALCDRIGALSRVLGADRHASVDPEVSMISARLDHMAGALSAAGGERASLDETLRDLRLAVAEIASENQRLRIA